MTNINVTEGSGKIVRTVTKDTNKEHQVVILDLGGAGAESLATTLIPTSKQLFNISLTPTNSTSIYTAGDCIGGKQTLTNAMRTSGGSGIWKSVHITEKGQQRATLIFHIFNADPSSATITDQSPITFSTDLPKLIHTVVVPSSAYVDDTGYAFASVLVDLPVIAVGSANLYLAITTPSTPDYVTTTDLILDFVFEQN